MLNLRSSRQRRPQSPGIRPGKSVALESRGGLNAAIFGPGAAKKISRAKLAPGNLPSLYGCMGPIGKILPIPHFARAGVPFSPKTRSWPLGRLRRACGNTVPCPGAVCGPQGGSQAAPKGHMHWAVVGPHKHVLNWGATRPGVNSPWAVLGICGGVVGAPEGSPAARQHGALCAPRTASVQADAFPCRLGDHAHSTPCADSHRSQAYDSISLKPRT